MLEKIYEETNLVEKTEWNIQKILHGKYPQNYNLKDTHKKTQREIYPEKNTKKNTTRKLYRRNFTEKITKKNHKWRNIQKKIYKCTLIEKDTY